MISVLFDSSMVSAVSRTMSARSVGELTISARMYPEHDAALLRCVRDAQDGSEFARAQVPRVIPQRQHDGRCRHNGIFAGTPAADDPRLLNAVGGWLAASSRSSERSTVLSCDRQPFHRAQNGAPEAPGCARERVSKYAARTDGSGQGAA